MKNQPATRQKALHLWVMARFPLTPSLPHIRSPLLSSPLLSLLSTPPHPPSPILQSLLHVRDLFLWSPACNSRPWAHLAVSVPRGPPVLSNSRGSPPASSPPSSPSTPDNAHLKEVHSLCNAVFNYLSSAEPPLACEGGSSVSSVFTSGDPCVFATLNANSCHAACHTAPRRPGTRLAIHAKC